MIRKNLEESTQKWISWQNRELLSHIDLHLDTLSNEISKEMERVIDSYKSIFDGIISELKHSKDTIESRMEFLENAGESMEGFCKLWSEFRNKQKEA